MKAFPSIRIEGGLLGPDILDQLLAGELPGQHPTDFGLDVRRNLTDEIAAAFADARALWGVFKHRLERLPESDPGTSLTRDAWVIPFLGLLGYELRFNPRAYEVDGLTFAISHRAGEAEDAPPVHIVGARQELGRLAPTGRPRLAPHSLLQEFLNRTERLWGIVTNGFTLRLLRDSTYIRRQAYVEFNLADILDEQHFEDFVALYRLLHRTRLPRTTADAHECFLERYFQHSVEQGGRVRDRLRDGVEECIKRLANGFLAHPNNSDLRQRIASREQRAVSSAEDTPLAPEDLYRQLLRLVYRFLFLLVSEDRGLISPNPLYREHYGISRLRRLVDIRSAYNDYDDIWHGLRVLWKVLSDEKLAPFLEVAPLNGELFAEIELDICSISNRDLLEAFWHLAYYQESPSSPPRRVNYGALDVEELGSVYESLLEYHPQIDTSGTVPRFELAPGSERKSTGSYYTPPELVAELIRSALEPVIAERLASSERRAESSDASELTLEEKRYVYSVISRPASVAERHGLSRASLPTDPVVSQGGTLRTDLANPPSRDIHSSEHRGRMGATDDRGIPPVPAQRPGQPSGIGNPSSAGTSVEPGNQRPDSTSVGNVPGAGAPTDQPSAQPFSEKAFLRIWQSLPLTARRSLLAEYSLLSIRVLDPACGSGHFLLAAARRLGKELAKIRTGEDEPAPERVREAIRDVVGHCIYGVDKNPLAVDLCRVALWLEAHCEGKPLTFLDHRIKCGDSLVGVMDLDVLKEGIPDEAFAPVSTDAKATAGLLKKRNRSERRALESGQIRIPFAPEHVVDALGARHHAIEAIADDSPAAVREKKNRYDRLLADPERRRLAEACDLWTAAFFQRFTPELATSPAAITTDAVTDHLAGRAHPQALAAAQALAEHHRFFHWPLEFPEVFSGSGEERTAKRHSHLGQKVGFQVVLGNPPHGADISSGARKFRAGVYLEVQSADNSAADFIALAKRLISENGRVGYVIPKSFTYSHAWLGTRNLVLPRLIRAVDVGRAWESVLLEQVLVTFVGGGCPLEAPMVVLRGMTSPPQPMCIDRSIAIRLGVVPTGLSTEDLELAAQVAMASSTTLANLCRTTRGGAAQRYMSRTGEIPVIGGREIAEFRSPSVRGYLNREQVPPRVIRLTCPPQAIFQNIVAHLTRPADHIRLIGTIADDVFACLDTVNLLTPTSPEISPYFLCGLLMSDLINWYVYRCIYNRAIRTMHFDGYFLAKIPAPASHHWKRIEDAAREVAADPSVSAAWRSLNQEVFDAFGVDRALRAYVEEMHKPRWAF